MSRRTLPVAVALLFITSGCLGLITGETVTFAASPATVADGTLDSTDYELRNASQANVTETVSVAGQERTLRLTNERRTYARSGTVFGVEVVELSRFVVLSTPTAEVAGQDLNPAAALSNRALITEASTRTGAVSDIDPAGNRTAQSLGESRQVSMFTGTTEVLGQSVDVRLHVVSFEHEGDVIVAVAVHPDRIDEDAAVDDLLAGLEHSGD